MRNFLIVLGDIYLFLFSLYHVITGIVAIFFSKFALRFYKILYGFDPIETEQLMLTFKPWGALALVVGIIGFFTFMRLDLYYPIFLAFIILLFIRAASRSIFFRQLHTKHHVTYLQNLRMVIIQLLGISLFLYLFFINIY